MISSPLHLWVLLAAPVCMIAAVRAPAPRVALEAAGLENAPARASWSVAVAAAACCLPAVWLAPNLRAAFSAAILLVGLARLAAVDIATMVIPVRFAFALIAAGLAFAMLGGWDHVARRVLAALAAWASFRLLDLAFVKLRGTTGLGSGDALIVAAIAAWLGPLGAAWGVVIGALCMLAWQLMLGLRRDTPTPFAPGLAIGAFGAVMLSYFYPTEAWSW